MASRLAELYAGMIESMGVEGIRPPFSAVKFFKHGESIPEGIVEHLPTDLTLTSCQAVRQASLGDPVLLTIDNIGCVAAAISLGLVDRDRCEPLSGPRVYTEIMRSHAMPGTSFRPPSPREFTDGTVYACKDAGRLDLCLFGEEDSGRFKDRATAVAAISEMAAIQPAVMKGVFFFPADFEADGVDLTPDVVVLSVRPVELTRIVQAWQYRTGRRVAGDMGGLRAVPSDLIAKPFLTQELNVSCYCLGARLIARFEADRLGLGMPFSALETIVEGMRDSKTGYPFPLYPGALEL